MLDPTRPMITLLAVGDIMLKTKSGGDPFKNVSALLREKDILFGNLETVLTTSRSPREKAVRLGSHPDQIRFLKGAGFDVMNIANNHVYDYGAGGFSEEMRLLEEAEIVAIGGGTTENANQWIFEKNGVSVGFLGYTDVGFLSSREQSVFIAEMNLERMIAKIQALKSSTDFIIVSLHWGHENVPYPSPKQINSAHALIEAGAHVILGHHPHVVQGVEEYQGGLIAYSLGNFQFDGALSYTKPRSSIILKIGLTKNHPVSFDCLPVCLDDQHVPALDRSGDTLHMLKKLSDPIRNGTLTWSMFMAELAPVYLSGNTRSYWLRMKRYGIRHGLAFIRWLATPFVLLCCLSTVLSLINRIKRHWEDSPGFTV